MSDNDKKEATDNAEDLGFGAAVFFMCMATLVFCLGWFIGESVDIVVDSDLTTLEAPE